MSFTRFETDNALAAGFRSPTSGNRCRMANRRVQGGGDPAQGPLPDEIRRMPDVGASDSFPDVPPSNRSDLPGESGNPHDVDLDAFAERLGVRDGGDRRPDVDRDSEGGQRGPAVAARRAVGVARGAAGLAAHAAAHGLSTAGRTLDRIGDRIDRR
jgi:hypothetical protein